MWLVMGMQWRKWLLSAALGLVVLAAAGCTGAESEKETFEVINIGFPSAGSDWPGGVLGVAAAAGYLEEYLNPLGYTARLQGFAGAAPAIHEALVSKDLDYVVYAGMAGVLGRASQIDTQLLGVTAFTCGWRLVTAAGSGIESAADLAGKTVAYQRGASPQMYLLRVLSEGNVAFEAVEGVNLSLPDGLAAVAAGSIDAAVVAAGQEAGLVAAGKAAVIHKGFEADRAVYYEPSVLIGRRAVIEKDEAAGAAIIKALLKAKDRIAGDTSAYYQLSADKSGNSLEVIMATAQEDIESAFPLNLEEPYIDALKAIQTFLTDYQLTGGIVDFDEWINRELMEQAIKEYHDED